MANRFRKLGIPLLACALLMPASLALAGTATAATEAKSTTKSSADFSDLKDLDAATKAKFDAIINAGIFDGVGDGMFGLNEEMNRAQFAKVAALIFNLKVDDTLKTSSFIDVKADDPANGYALPYIEAVKAAGITAGTGKGAFDPAGTVTKEQLATFLVRGLGKEEDAKKTPGVSDSTVSDWAKGYVAIALELKVLPGGEDGKFGGTTEAKRDLLAVSSFNTAQKVETPLAVNEANLDANEELTIGFTTAIDPKSIKLSNIKINGIALDDTLDSFELSADGKTLIIKLRKGFALGQSSKPEIDVTGISSRFDKPITPPEKPVEVTVTNPPPPVIIPYVPPATGPSVTSVTYSVYSAEDSILDFTVAYSPSGPAKAYYVFTKNPEAFAGITPQRIKAIAQDIGDFSDPVTSDLWGDGNEDLEATSDGGVFHSGDWPFGHFTMFLVIEKDGRLSSNVYELEFDYDQIIT